MNGGDEDLVEARRSKARWAGYREMGMMHLVVGQWREEWADGGDGDGDGSVGGGGDGGGRVGLEGRR